MQVEEKRWLGAVLARRETCRVICCGQTSSNRYIDREPFRLDAICWQSCIHSIDRWSRIKDVVARRVGAIVWASGMRIVRIVRGLCGRG